MYYDISEVSRLFGLSPSGIRYYEEKGLLAPARSEGGRRQYSEEDLLGLMYLSKVHTLGMTLEETRDYFHYRNAHLPQEAGALMLRRVPEVREKAAYYAMLADWLENIGAVLSAPETHIGQWVPEETPAYYCLNLHPLFGKNRHQQEAVARWLAIAPLNQGIDVTDIEEGNGIDAFSGFGVQQSYADALALPLREQAVLLPAARSVRTIVETVGEDAYGLTRPRILALYRSACRETGWTRVRIVSKIFHVYQQDGKTHKLYQLWVSLLPAE